MKRILILIYVFVCSLNVGAIIYNNMNIQNNNSYTGSYTGTYNSIPFNSTSSSPQIVNYNTVKPLNADGSVSMEYTTYGNVYRPRRNNLGGGLSGGDDGIGEKDESVPIGDPIIPFLIIMFAYLSYHEIKKRR